MHCKTKGISLIEFLFVITIIVILSSFAIPAWNRFIEINRYYRDIMEIEYAINRAKILAMERVTNIGICVPNVRTLIINNLEYNREADPCGGNEIFKVILEEESQNQILHNGQIKFDPRGLCITDENVCGSICVYNRQIDAHYMICIYKGTIKTIKSIGPCPAACF